MTNRREFIQRAIGAAAVGLLPSSISRALAIPATTFTGTIRDVQHVVILIQENRAFDHYFGTLRGVRGFGDRHPVPLASGKPVWFQNYGDIEIPPYRLDSRTTSALRVPDTPHSFADAQAAWNQGKFGFWPKFKTPFSMGHYTREDIPFQFALAEAFTICDAYHCSITTGTDPNRIMFWSGSNFDPVKRARGENCTDADSEPDNLRCWIKGALPDPGYTYAGSALTWPTIPEVLEQAGISWRIYQDPNDNWTGAMHGGLAFEGFRAAKPGSPLYEKGMRHWSLEQLAEDARTGHLPQVSWVLPPALWSEHPGPSSPLHGASFTAKVLDSLTTNPAVWGRTVLFLTFDENDGLFDHVPPPAPPSYSPDGTLAGKATLDLRGLYFEDPEHKHLHPEDRASGTVRPWGLGPRVPMLVISPWSKGGWVNSQVFDHTSVGQFLERRFGVTVPAISPWHRAVCGDLTGAFDFAHPNEASIALPEIGDAPAIIAAHSRRPKPSPPTTPEPLFQEPGVRPSRALPYRLQVHDRIDAQAGELSLQFDNHGRAGAVFHVYDRLHLDRIPRRYTVEAGRSLSDGWDCSGDDGRYDLCVYGPNGFVREYRGSLGGASGSIVLHARDNPANGSLVLTARNGGKTACVLTVRPSAYRHDGPWQMTLTPGRTLTRGWSAANAGHWYDLIVSAAGFERRFAGRIETGAHGISDPAMGTAG